MQRTKNHYCAGRGNQEKRQVVVKDEAEKERKRCWNKFHKAADSSPGRKTGAADSKTEALSVGLVNVGSRVSLRF